ncbi:TIGR03746 family integrating conjugative element protein [Diaphorobacter sp. HDW4A]|uniref:PFL_4703 family integrating conjugative element protein n=1 Tax=Diaphorobacter sp. HDW4A TaxID=2714924 RepID=UPI0014073A1A|nr:TIGR03746 family integrating conjugative element protein [Diaphorobacter sp. HDW4A]QIL80329.1 TIGR03746 family integrating conjugative element protein [Diaphorobacter sp. HDW4A]
MSKVYLDALATARSANESMRTAMAIIAVIGIGGIFVAARTPKHIEVHLAPHIQGGDVISAVDGESDVPPVNVYGFAYYIWQQLNRWQADGAADYGKQIYLYQSYITSSCRSQLENDLQVRSGGGELRGRTRIMSEIPAFGYAPNRVIAEGTSAWTVLLDMQIQEAYKGQPVKDVFIRYPIRVVRYDVDRERNPWRLAIDCYGGNRPGRLAAAEVTAVQKGQQKPSLPASVVPATLPGAAAQAPVTAASATQSTASTPQ